MTPALRQLLPTTWETPQPDPSWYRDPALKDALAACKATTKEHATSFYFSSFPLSKEKKSAAYAVYAFCRWVDDVIDEAPDPSKVDPAMVSGELDKLLAGESALPFAPAFRAVTEQYGIPKNFYDDLIEGCCMDLRPVLIQTYEQLEVYCYYVASVVGLIMSKLFGLKDLEGVERAVEMGVAMQLTNVLRDVREDFENGRIYLPKEEMVEFNTGPECIAARRVNDPQWTAFMKFQVQRAKDTYAAAEAGLKLLAGDGSRLCARMMSRVYGGILDEIIRHDYDVLTERRYVPTARKVRIAMRALWM
ncbi:MAG: phytoene/squalene synthase family protein [Verrucomicrobiota bacterium]